MHIKIQYEAQVNKLVLDIKDPKFFMGKLANFCEKRGDDPFTIPQLKDYLLEGIYGDDKDAIKEKTNPQGIYPGYLNITVSINILNAKIRYHIKQRAITKLYFDVNFNTISLNPKAIMDSQYAKLFNNIFNKTPASFSNLHLNNAEPSMANQQNEVVPANSTTAIFNSYPKQSESVAALPLEPSLNIIDNNGITPKGMMPIVTENLTQGLVADISTELGHQISLEKINGPTNKRTLPSNEEQPPKQRKKKPSPKQRKKEPFWKVPVLPYGELMNEQGILLRNLSIKEESVSLKFLFHKCPQKKRKVIVEKTKMKPKQLAKLLNLTCMDKEKRKYRYTAEFKNYLYNIFTESFTQEYLTTVSEEERIQINIQLNLLAQFKDTNTSSQDNDNLFNNTPNQNNKTIFKYIIPRSGLTRLELAKMMGMPKSTFFDYINQIRATDFNPADKIKLYNILVAQFQDSEQNRPRLSKLSPQEIVSIGNYLNILKLWANNGENIIEESESQDNSSTKDSENNIEEPPAKKQKTDINEQSPLEVAEEDSPFANVEPLPNSQTIFSLFKPSKIKNVKNQEKYEIKNKPASL